MLTRSAGAAYTHPHSDILIGDPNVVKTKDRVATPSIERVDTYRKNFNIKGNAADFNSKTSLSIATEGQNIKGANFRAVLTIAADSGTLVEGWAVKGLQRVQITLGGNTVAEYRYLPAWKALVDRADEDSRLAARAQMGNAHDLATGPATAVIPLFFFDRFIQQKFGSRRDGRVDGVPLGLRSAFKFELFFGAAGQFGDTLVNPSFQSLEIEFEQLTGNPTVDFVTGWENDGFYCFTEEETDVDRFAVPAGVTKAVRVTDVDGSIEMIHYDLVAEALLLDNTGYPVSIEFERFDLKLNASSLFDNYDSSQRIHAWQQSCSDYFGKRSAPRGVYAPLGRGAYVDDLASVSEWGTQLSASDDLVANITVQTGVAARCLVCSIKQVKYKVTPNRDLDVIFQRV